MLARTKPKELPSGKLKYSPMEQQLYNQLRRGKRITSTVLMERLYKDNLEQHFYARETVNAALSSLRRKLDFNKAPIRLQRSRLSGPHPIEWWLE